MPIFGLRKAFSVGRKLKVFVNLQAGATRGEVPDPWSRGKAPQQGSGKGDREAYRFKKQVKRQRETIFQLKNELEAANRLAEDARNSVSSPQPSGEIGALPDFVVIGAARCGTSRFYGILTRHPFVRRAAVKELHFFDRADRFERGVDWYKEHFPPPETKDGQRTVTGEATPVYLFDPAVPERMARAVPEARLIVLLRNPVDRALSQYHRLKRTGADLPSFKETVEDELAHLADGRTAPGLAGDGSYKHTQLARGIYADQLLRWREFFPEERMLVIKSEDFFADVPGTLEKTQDFLGIPRRGVEVPPEKTGRQSKYEYEPMDPGLRQRLAEFFEPHNRRLYDLLGRDLGW